MTDDTRKLIELTADLAATHTAARVMGDMNDLRETVTRIDERTKTFPSREEIEEKITKTVGKAIKQCQAGQSHSGAGPLLTKKQWAQIISIVIALLSAAAGLTVAAQ